MKISKSAGELAEAAVGLIPGGATLGKVANAGTALAVEKLTEKPKVEKARVYSAKHQINLLKMVEAGTNPKSVQDYFEAHKAELQPYTVLYKMYGLDRPDLLKHRKMMEQLVPEIKENKAGGIIYAKHLVHEHKHGVTPDSQALRHAYIMTGIDLADKVSGFDYLEYQGGTLPASPDLVIEELKSQPITDDLEGKNLQPAPSAVVPEIS